MEQEELNQRVVANRKKRALRNMLPFRNPFPEKYENIFVKPGELLLYASGNQYLLPPSTMYPWQFAHTGATFSWKFNQGELQKLGVTRMDPTILFPEGFEFDPQTGDLHF